MATRGESISTVRPSRRMVPVIGRLHAEQRFRHLGPARADEPGEAQHLAVAYLEADAR